MAEYKFDYKSHLIKVQGKDYLPVNKRIMWFRNDHPEGQIVTEVIQTQPFPVIKATISVNGIVLSTGLGSADPVKGAKTTWAGREIEKAETAAVGRALASGGWGINFVDDTEFDDRKHLADAPTEKPKQRLDWTLDYNTWIQNQFGKTIEQLAKDLGLNEPKSYKEEDFHYLILENLAKENGWLKVIGVNRKTGKASEYFEVSTGKFMFNCALEVGNEYFSGVKLSTPVQFADENLAISIEHKGDFWLVKEIAPIIKGE